MAARLVAAHRWPREGLSSPMSLVTYLATLPNDASADGGTEKWNQGCVVRRVNALLGVPAPAGGRKACTFHCHLPKHQDMTRDSFCQDGSLLARGFSYASSSI